MLSDFSCSFTRASFHRLDLVEKQSFSVKPRRHIPTDAINGYNAGDLITSCRPFAKALNEIYKGKLCDYCLEIRTDLKRCKACETFYYCSKECQIADWNEGHKFKECNLYKMDKGRTLEKQTALCRLIARIYLILRNSNNIKSLTAGDEGDETSSIMYKDFVCFNGHKRNFIELISHFDNVKSNPIMDTFWTFKGIYKDVLRSKYDWCSDDLLVIMGIINSNAFEIARTSDKPLAYGLFIETAIFDHSCVANARFAFEKDEMKILAVRQINPGDKIYIHYTDPEPRDEFYTIMKTTHYFTCDCSLCNKLTPLERDKLEFNVLRRTYHGHSYRGYILLGMLTLKQMIALSKKWPEEEHMNTDVENLLALDTLAQLGDSVDKSAFGLPSFDEVYAKRNSTEVSRSLSSSSVQLVKYMDSCQNHKVAEREFKAGDCIRDGIPCFYVVLPQFKQQYCNFCLANVTGPVEYSCDSCGKFTYCSTECCNADRILHQAFECVLNSKDTNNFLQNSENAEMSLYLRMYMSIKTHRLHFRYRDEKVYESADDEVNGTTTNKQTKSSANDALYKVFCKNTNILPSKFGSPLFDMMDFIEESWLSYNINYDRLVDIFMFASSNMFYIYDVKTNEKIAIGSFTSLRLTEHSLNHNSEYLLQKGKLSLRAKETIPSGSSINIGYH